VAAVTDKVTVHATGGGEVALPAVETLHLYRFREIFEVGAANEATGGRGHVLGVRWYMYKNFIRSGFEAAICCLFRRGQSY
jgi:hypothetical protein